MIVDIFYILKLLYMFVNELPTYEALAYSYLTSGNNTFIINFIKQIRSMHDENNKFFFR